MQPVLDTFLLNIAGINRRKVESVGFFFYDGRYTGVVGRAIGQLM